MKSFGLLVARSIKDVVNDNQRIRQLITSIVPAETLDHIIFFRIDGKRLRVSIDSSAWVLQLRFREQAIVRALRQQGYDIRDVCSHVAPAVKPARPKQTRTRPRVADSSIVALEHMMNQLETEKDSPESELQRDSLARLVRQLRVHSKNSQGES